ncbi:uncharacterized protein LOC116445393 isoform X3 [Corvus moneduloides]|uniref:uncharacterized protein LOC116445393 isoform X3 n=1 Tax=Corvus moneduloides TaxID=1196302 RepID=UPI001363953B|nr:uncharacterized protein LOC116445393 isoform X3 [Corvus moneduloides]
MDAGQALGCGPGCGQSGWAVSAWRIQGWTKRLLSSSLQWEGFGGEKSPASLGQDLSQSLLGPGSEREAANGAGEFLGALWQRTSRTASSPSWTAGMPSIALVSEWEWLLGALAGPAPFQGKADERIKMQRNKCCKPPRLSDRANLPVMPVHRSERLWDHKVFQESKTRTEMWE